MTLKLVAKYIHWLQFVLTEQKSKTEIVKKSTVSQSHQCEYIHNSRFALNALSTHYE